MPLTDDARLAVLEQSYADMREDVTAMREDVTAIRLAVCGETAARRAGWKVLTVVGAVVLGIGTLWHDLGDKIAKIFA